MAGEDEQSASTGITTRQVVTGAAVVLIGVLVLALYSTRTEAPSAAEQARRQVIDRVIEACERFDEPDQTELDEACAALLGDESPL